MSFDDREKKYDRAFNKIYVDFRKFTTVETCPTCNITDVLKPLRDLTYIQSRGKRKLKKIKWIHDDENCFCWYASIVLAGLWRDKKISEDFIEKGYKLMKAYDKKFTEKGT